MTEFAGIVKKTIDEHSLLRREGRIIVAVSGGADSVALLAVLLELGYDCVAAHCNFHLRGEESNRDMRHVAKITERLNIDLYIKEFDVHNRMRDTGESVEMACRELRYAWFYDLLERNQAQAIAVGHHCEDQTETFFLNLLRGSGLIGLAGMRHRTQNIVRPLLDCSRTQIENYLVERHLDWVMDKTNASDEFLRNRLRNRLLPFFEKLFPGASQAILRSMSFLREAEQFYSTAIAERASRYTNIETGEMDLKELINKEPSAPLILFEWLKKEGFTRTQTDDMLRTATHSGGSFRAGASHIRAVDHGILRAAHAGQILADDAVDVNLCRDITEPINIKITVHDVAEFKAENNNRIAYIDVKALEGNPLWQLRHWRRGDRMRPFGMNGTKLVSNIFAQAHLSFQQKAQTWLLTRNEEIIWVTGIRASSHFAISPSTRNYLRLELI